MYQRLRTKEYQSKKKPSQDKKMVAIWLDQETAEIFAVSDHQINKCIIKSELPRKHRSTGGVQPNPPYERHALTSEHNENRWRDQMTKKFFSHIISHLDDASRIVLMGPGETKNLLQREINTIETLRSQLDSEPVTVGEEPEGVKYG